jgi:hypothetical protein
MGLQDVHVGTTASACKTCVHAATVQCQYCGPLVRHRYSAGRLDSMAPRCSPSAAWQAIRPGVPMPLKTSFATISW